MLHLIRYRHRRRLLWPLACAVCGLYSASAEAQSLYFRPAASGGAPVGGGTYTWNTSLTNWYTTQTGGSATTWSDGNTAILRTTGSTGYNVTLASDVVVAGITQEGPQSTTNSPLTISSASTRTITFQSGAVVAPNGGDAGRGLVFGTNVSLSGNFRINGSAAANPVSITGNTYSGTVTIQQGTLRIDNGGSTADTKVLLDSPNARLSLNGGVTGTIAQLSGTAGVVNRLSTTATLVVNQATDTSFGGTLESTAWTFRKAGVGTLVLNGTGNNTNRAMAVDAGELFVRGDSTQGAQSANTLTVAGAATYGGVGSLGTKNVTLSASNSRLTPGMFDLDTNEQMVGTLPLGSGTISAVNGGIFDFALQVVGGTLTNSKMSLASGGALTLGSNKTFDINLIDLGVTGLATGTHTITLFSTGSALGNYSTFESQWKLNTATLPTNWSLADPGNEFSIVGNDIVMSFVVAVPEPATILMALPLPFYLAWRGRMRRRHSPRQA